MNLKALRTSMRLALLLIYLAFYLPLPGVLPSIPSQSNHFGDPYVFPNSRDRRFTPSLLLLRDNLKHFIAPIKISHFREFQSTQQLAAAASNHPEVYSGVEVG